MAAHITFSMGDNGEVTRHEAAPIESLPSLTDASTSTSPFLKLPAEIRTKIYRYLLIPEHGIRLEKTSYPTRAECSLVCNNDAAEHPGDGVQILRTCRFIYREAAAVLYSENKFSYMETDDCFSTIGAVWLPHSSNFNISLIKSLTLRLSAETMSMRNASGRTTRERAWATLSFTFAETLPEQLEHITVGTTISCWRKKAIQYSPSARTPVHIRSRILLLASIVTRVHPKIKKAVWQANNGVKYIDPHAICTTNETFIRLELAGKATDIGTTTYRARSGEYVDKRDIVLDCAKIRALNWKERDLLDELDFALPDDALSSELFAEKLDESTEWYLETYKLNYIHRPSLAPELYS